MLDMLNEIGDAIIAAKDRGCSELVIDQQIDKRIIDIIRSAGYYVEVGTHSWDPYVIIKWWN